MMNWVFPSFKDAFAGLTGNKKLRRGALRDAGRNGGMRQVRQEMGRARRHIKNLLNPQVYI